MPPVRRILGAVLSALAAHLARSWRRWMAFLTLAFVVIAGFNTAFSPPKDFPAGSIVSVARGASAPAVAEQFFNARLIKNPSLLRFVLRASGAGEHVQAGVYLFTAPQDLLTITYRLATGDSGLPPVRLTFTEGMTARDIAGRVAEAFSDISESSFLTEAQPYEGYLFPDTYLFSPSADAASIVKTMRENFDAKSAALAPDLAASGRSLSDIVVMASLIEKEARTVSNKRIVAGVLWNRLALGMPLQVDAVFGYIFGRDTYSPSFADLKVDSPYNTYAHTGLPPGPIDNPGLDSLEAALHPTETDYLYYLTGSDNLMHYATTFAGHQANQRKYLR